MILRPAVAAFVSLVSTLVGQTDPAAKPAAQDPEAAAAKVLAEVKAQFAKEGLTLDAKAGTLTIKATVNQPRDPVEYLLVHRRGKRHESVFWTPAKASILNAGLLMLGLEAGKNADYQEKVPAPTLEEIEAGADPVIVTPPQGKPFWITVHWTTADGTKKDYCIEDLLLDLATEKPVETIGWVYLGGRMAKIYKDEPEVYVADFEGNLFSICYLTPDNHLATMVHERARDDQNWWLTDALQPPDTEVQLVVHKQKPKLYVEREARQKQAKAGGDQPAAKVGEESGEKSGGGK